MKRHVRAVFFLGFGAIFAAGSLVWFSVAGTADPVWSLGGVLFLGFGLVVAFIGLAQLLAAAQFQVATLKVAGPARLGGQAQVQLALIPKRTLAIKTIQCKLQLRTVERARYSAGTQSRTYEDRLHESSVPFEFPNSLDPTGLVRELTVQIPRDIPPSWKGSSNSLTTTLALHLAIEQWPDLKLEAEVRVLPEVAP